MLGGPCRGLHAWALERGSHCICGGIGWTVSMLEALMGKLSRVEAYLGKLDAKLGRSKAEFGDLADEGNLDLFLLLIVL